MEFKFKQFSVEMTEEVFKVGTDASLLGSLLETPIQTAKMLEIGTGTGVISLMIAQRYNDAFIDAIDISPKSVDLATSNFLKSPFNNINAYLSDAKSYKGDSKYDVIFTNPPYHLEQVHSTNEMKHRSKSHDNLLLDDLVYSVKQNLASDGDFWVIAPPAYIDLLTVKLDKIELYQNDIFDIKHLENSKVSRQVVRFSNNKTVANKKAFILYKEKRLFSDQAKEKLSPYLIVL